MTWWGWLIFWVLVAALLAWEFHDLWGGDRR